MRRVVALLILFLLVPSVASISIKELISKYLFSSSTPQMNVTGYADFMVDSNDNGINDTLVFELTTSNAAGNFIFVINLFDKNSVLANETSITLLSGINKLNITFGSALLSQGQFNYSIKVYNSTHSLKYRKDNITIQYYQSYEQGFSLLGVKDSRDGKTLRINVTVNSSISGIHEAALFLSYNNSIIFLKENKSIEASVNHLLFDFDNETIKRTHYAGNFSVPSLKVGGRTIKTNFTTAFYDFRDFAASSYILGFADGLAGAGNKHDTLQINTTLEIIGSGDYNLLLGLYDLFGNIVEQKNVSYTLNDGENVVPVGINGSKIYEKRLNGPFIVKYIGFYKDNALIDWMNDAYTTGNYNFNDFNKPSLPDLIVNISISDGYHYGIGNITINFTFKNAGNSHAFNVFTEVFDNKTFFKANQTSFLGTGSQIMYQFNFTNISDFEISATADLSDFVEELNESNNAEKAVVKLNKPPKLALISNLTVNETGRIIINLSASDPNGDELSFSINLSKFSKNDNMLEWNTTTMDNGNYTLSAAASDGFLDDAVIFKIVVLDAPEIDFDNDGLNDSIDTLIGDENSVNTSTLNLKIFLGDSSNLSKFFNESRKVRLKDNNLTIVEFDFDFSKHKLNLTNITVNKQDGNTTGSLIIRGLALPLGETKTLYLDKINSGLNGICIKEAEISAINEISDNCNLPDEFRVECDGTLQDSYKCAYNSTWAKYRVQGLKHSGIVQFDYAKPLESGSSAASSGSSGSSGGGGGSCTPNWQCSEWSECISGFENRKCSDANQCFVSLNKPAELQECFDDKADEIPEGSVQTLSWKKETSNKIKEGLSKEFAGITGQAVKLIPKIKSFSDAVDIFAVVLVIAALYLAIYSTFLENL